MNPGHIFAGTAGEHLALYQLAMHGIVAHHVPANDYDAFVVASGQTYRLQVKARSSCDGAYGYGFKCSIERGRTGGTRGSVMQLTDANCELMAFVALDVGRVIFRKTSELPQASVYLRPNEFVEGCETESLRACGLLPGTADEEPCTHSQMSLYGDAF